jgi:precorrin-6B methylase 2
MSTQSIRDFINRHTPSVTALGALGALLDAKASGTPLDPALDARLREYLAVHGLTDVEVDAAGDAAPFDYDLRQHNGNDWKLLYPSTRATSRVHTDPLLLQAAGDFSKNFARALTANIVPKLDGLAPLTTFLDVGVGVGSLSIELATLWPQLKITGIDVWQPSLALARSNVKAAGLADRITLREQAAEAVTDERAFDLVWLPIIFMAERCIPTALDRAREALRPGGWTLLAFGNWDVPDPHQRSYWRLRTTMMGGPLWTI